MASLLKPASHLANRSRSVTDSAWIKREIKSEIREPVPRIRGEGMKGRQQTMRKGIKGEGRERCQKEEEDLRASK